MYLSVRRVSPRTDCLPLWRERRGRVFFSSYYPLHQDYYWYHCLFESSSRLLLMSSFCYYYSCVFCRYCHKIFFFHLITLFCYHYNFMIIPLKIAISSLFTTAFHDKFHHDVYHHFNTLLSLSLLLYFIVLNEYFWPNHLINFSYRTEV